MRSVSFSVDEARREPVGVAAVEVEVDAAPADGADGPDGAGSAARGAGGGARRGGGWYFVGGKPPPPLDPERPAPRVIACDGVGRCAVTTIAELVCVRSLVRSFLRGSNSNDNSI